MARVMLCSILVVLVLVLTLGSGMAEQNHTIELGIRTQLISNGSWELLMRNSGVSAMHMALTHTGKVIIFDRSDYGPSNITLPDGKCRMDKRELVLKKDCWAHSVEYDVANNSVRPLMIETDTWCSGGAMDPEGNLLQTGGYNDGDRVVRIIKPCDTCDWIEYPDGLAVRRWYATDAILPEGNIIVVGGRHEFGYEFVPKQSAADSTVAFPLPFLEETTDAYENNLYPFVHLAPDGNLFVFANTRSVLLDYKRHRIVRRYPDIQDARNYPSSGSSVLLPLDGNHGFRQAMVLICGGAKSYAFAAAMEGRFITASATCGRLNITDLNPRWEMENMPIPRVMGDMLLLPTGDVLILNGARKGTAGWFYGRDPVLEPVIYKPDALESTDRFYTLSPTSIPRLYHSSCHLLPDGRVLVGGSNPNILYSFSGVDFPTELSLEAFSPPYLDPTSRVQKPTITSLEHDVISYGESFVLEFSVGEHIDLRCISITLVAPSFTTHSFSMNQRLLRLRVLDFVLLPYSKYQVSIETPRSKNVAPPGYYLVFVVNEGIPSPGKWVQLK